MKTSAIFLLISLSLTTTINAVNNTVEPEKRFANNRTAGLMAYLNEVTEENIAIESWMLDIDEFDAESEFTEIEDWMLDPSAFEKPETNNAGTNVFNIDESVFEEFDETMELVEDWMLDVEKFRTGANNTVLIDYLEEDYEEEILPIEDWMFNF
ncbi:hypothetical protein [Anaerophaga thermohalophila]|jgi:hypothetical protein|uniref:hypothetical protein n=1 Tax=Anaerophaga thermohalophila TaxID=177400 RepID=UPI0002F3B9C1|nr:hypothetical protein [Anaerophaga thermohalophila]